MDHGRTAPGLVGTAGGGVPGDRPDAGGAAQERRLSQPLAGHGSPAQRRHEIRACNFEVRPRQSRTPWIQNGLAALGLDKTSTWKEQFAAKKHTSLGATELFLQLAVAHLNQRGA